MSNHTPGPWRINEGRKYYDELHRICKDGNGMIATVVNIVDAHLIVASPDLLEALENIAKTCPDTVASEIAIRAIAKAKGE